METQHPKQRQNNLWNLLAGLAFIAFGGYRLYAHFINNDTQDTLRLILAFAFVGFGIFRLFTYFKGR